MQLIPATARAEKRVLVIFKDGFSARGELKQPGEIVSDQSGQGIWVPQAAFYLDEGARRILFSHPQLQDVIEQDRADEPEIIKLATPFSRYNAKHMYPIVQLIDSTPWDEKWERMFKFAAPHGQVKARQRLSMLTPQYARVDSYNYFWTSGYLTRELGINTVQYLLSVHPELKPQGDSSDAARRFRIYRFLAQAGWYDEAEQELAKIDRDFPGENAKTGAAREDLKRFRALQLYEDILLADQGGRHAWVREHLGQVPRQGIDEKLLAGIRSMKAGYEATEENLRQARRLLQSLPRQVDATIQRQMFVDAAGAMLEELAPENVGRLEPFLAMALQSERDLKQNRKPAHDQAQLLALAVSGWLLGKESAEAKIDMAQRLWQGRQFVLDYERTDTAREREQLRRAYEARHDALPIDELTQVIAFLPPPNAENETGTEPMTFQIERKGGRQKGKISYIVQLPPEYHPGRQYPVVIALHPEREKPQVTLSRVADAAGQHGYILVAPEWTLPLEDTYGYTADEHAAVTDVLRDVRRRFYVDSDRVFLLGLQVGGNMAWDVGLAHPDLFAGVAVMGAQPRLFAGRYWHNAQHLPFYVVDGQYAAKNSERVRPVIEKWMPRGYPVLYVEYRGRGLEWFKYEQPYLFDWMDHKRDQRKRTTAVPDLGRHGNGGPMGEEYQTMRQGDNHFYWLSTSAVKEACLNDAADWKNERVTATLQGHINEGNQININVRGVKDVTLWLAKEMIDFTKPLTVRLNGGLAFANKKAIPSLSTLLEDLYQRGDRQRLFWAKIQFSRL
jgi:hypothetical protein